MHRHRGRQGGHAGALGRGRPDGQRLADHAALRGDRRRGARTASRMSCGGSTGVILVLIILAALAALIYYRSRGSKVDHNNVNAEWTGTVTPAETPAKAAA